MNDCKKEKKGRKSISKLLTERMHKEIDGFSDCISKKCKPRRLYHGHHQRSIGAFSWCIGGSIDNANCYGSCFTMKEILEAPNWTLFQGYGIEIEILPE